MRILYTATAASLWAPVSGFGESLPLALPVRVRRARVSLSALGLRSVGGRRGTRPSPSAVAETFSDAPPNANDGAVPGAAMMTRRARRRAATKNIPTTQRRSS